MIHFPKMTPAPSRKETIGGITLMALTLFVTPSILYFINDFLPKPMSVGMLNVVYYILNFLLTILVFRRFLSHSFKAALSRPFSIMWHALLGYLGFQTLSELLGVLIYYIYPEFSNVNDSNIFSMLETDLLPLAMSTIFLVPLAEETLYRGLIFRGLFDKRPKAAYLVSMAVFAAIHVMGYVGAVSPLVLLLCFVQYLPAGYCLCWCYRQTGTILCPVLMHTIVNASSIFIYLR